MDKQRQPGNNGMRKQGVLLNNKRVPHGTPKFKGNPHTTGKVKITIPSKMQRGKEHHVKTILPVTNHVLRKLYVIDTNVLMHDPSSIRHFQEHDLFIPLGVVEELDNHKSGGSDIARSARQVSRSFDELMTTNSGSANNASEHFSEGFIIDPLHPKTSGRLFLQSVPDQGDPLVGRELSLEKIDNQIIAITLGLRRRWHGVRYSDVVLVSNDTNVRIKARAFGITAEDYRNDQVIDDADNLFSGITEVPDYCVNELNKQRSDDSLHADMPMYTIPVIPDVLLLPNQLIHTKNGFNAIVREIQKDIISIQKPRNYISKHTTLGINARNQEQNFSLNLLLDPKIPIITLLGPAGSGKTLLTIVSALRQMSAHFGDKTYDTIIMTRVTIPIGEDIGFFPGTEEEKMTPWMGALTDNLQIIAQSYNTQHGENATPKNHPRVASPQIKRSTRQKIAETFETSDVTKEFDANSLRKYVQIRSMITMRGRTFVNTFVIIDEAQNLTPKQVKTIATRVGPGSKMIFLGNLAQIDNSYLTDRSSGLAYLAERFKGQKCYGHAILKDVVRSEVAQLAEELL